MMLKFVKATHSCISGINLLFTWCIIFFLFCMSMHVGHVYAWHICSYVRRHISVFRDTCICVMCIHSIYVFLCVRKHVYVHVCAYVEPWDWYWGSFSIAFHLIHWGKIFPMNSVILSTQSTQPICYWDPLSSLLGNLDFRQDAMPAEYAVHILCTEASPYLLVYNL